MNIQPIQMELFDGPVQPVLGVSFTPISRVYEKIDVVKASERNWNEWTNKWITVALIES